MTFRGFPMWVYGKYGNDVDIYMRRERTQPENNLNLSIGLLFIDRQ